jgi:hypothetical protein
LPARLARNRIVFKVAQEIIKHSDEFRMAFDRSTQNFTSLPQHAVIASDGDHVYTVQHAEELVVFPNPDVRVVCARAGRWWCACPERVQLQACAEPVKSAGAIFLHGIRCAPAGAASGTLAHRSSGVRHVRVHVSGKPFPSSSAA